MTSLKDNKIIQVDAERFHAMARIVKAAQAWRNAMIDRAGLPKNKEEAWANSMENERATDELRRAVDEMDKLLPRR